ncbi:MAG TPA: carbamoyltransferase N-terminal domain-containing protein, partial [Vampirovibrionales bacterium]
NSEKNLKKEDLAASFQEVVCRTLATKLTQAARDHNNRQIVIAGGVAANTRLKEIIEELGPELQLTAPKLNYCTDNGAMVAAAGYLCPESFENNFSVYSRVKNKN